jgi:putative two-component system response regulator
LPAHPAMNRPNLESRRILIVDDEPRNVLLLERALQNAGFASVLTTSDPTCAIPLCRDFRPDLLVLDLHMPVLDGFEIMRRLPAATPEDRYLPILVLTADATERTKRQALSAGARDFLTKPFSLTEALLRIRNLLEVRLLYLELTQKNEDLGELVAERTRELETTRLQVMERLCQAVEFRDDVTGSHTRRVGERSAILASAFGLPQREVDLIRRAAPLHDVGKIAIPDSILLKEGPLTPHEFSVMQRHTVVGADILAGDSSELMTTARSVAAAHHERWDGTGYPKGLAGEAIPIAARIVAVVDVFDAVTTPRHYRAAWQTHRALAEIRTGSGSHFDPSVVDVFLQVMNETSPGV